MDLHEFEHSGELFRLCYQRGVESESRQSGGVPHNVHEL